MTRTSIFIIGLSAALSFPTVAAANCGTMQGSYALSCEQGVKVYRHQALSGVPRSITQAEATVQAEKIRAKTAEKRLASEERASLRDADLRTRELNLEDYRARIYNRNTRRLSSNVGNSFNNRSSVGRFGSGKYGSVGFETANGYNYGQQTSVRTKGAKAKY